MLAMGTVARSGTVWERGARGERGKWNYINIQCTVESPSRTHFGHAWCFASHMTLPALRGRDLS